MKLIKSLFFAVALFTATLVQAQESALWLRYPAISPDGTTIAFCYKGDIFTVDVSGGKASQLTTHTAYDYKPVWSNDGKTIAFSSNRAGDFDVYTVPADGGAPTRITFNSVNETIETFSKDDKTIYFSAMMLPDAQYSQFPSQFSTIYTIPAEGGRPELFSSVYMEDMAFNNDGSKILYHDKKGYEDKWRKHHTSSVTRDVWMYDVKAKSYAQITDLEVENRNPVFVSNDNNSFYYLNEKNGTFNVYKRNLNDKTETQITKHEKHPVRFLSVANNNTLCYSFNGELFTIKEGAQSEKLEIIIKTDKIETEASVQFKTGGISEMSVSPDGKEIAFILRGDVYVTSADYATTKRITNTPEQERNVDFSPKGKSIVYASERNGCWNIYTTSLVRDEELMFTYASELKEEQITKGSAACFQPAFSPDGEEIAYFYERTSVKIINLKSKKIRTIIEAKYNYSYVDGDQWFSWSPDGKWLATNFFEKGGRFKDDLAIFNTDGSGEFHNLTNSGYADEGVDWVLDGKAITWKSDKNGMRSHGSWGAQNDIFIMFFDQEAYDEFLMSKEELERAEALKKEEKENEKKEADKKDKKEADEKKGDKKDDDEIKLPEVTYDIVNAEDRIVKLTITSAHHGSSFLSKDGKKFYYFAAFEKGFDLWVRDLKENTTKMLAKMGAGWASLDADKKQEKLFMLSGGKIFTIDMKTGTKKPVSISAEYMYRPALERDYIYDHAWKLVVDKFYDPNIHGIDWKMFGENYEQFLPHINNNFDFAELLGELLGELNASHTGAGYRAHEFGDNIAVLGMFFDNDYKGNGLKIKEVMRKNPMIKASSKIKEGLIIQKIDGNEIVAGEDYYRFLNHKAGKNVILTLSDGKETWEERVKPLSLGQQSELLYQRWIKQRADLVEELSDGKLGYVHVRGMDSPSFRKVYSDVLGKNRNKEAIIIDTRFNGGGWLHDDLATLFSGVHYADFVPRGQYVASEPLNKWTKPSCVLMGEGNYSDAHGFPFTYNALKIGKLVGMPVPGTMTAVWWETQIDPTLYFGIPQMGVKNLNGQYIENLQLEPDIKVSNTPQSMIEGQDLQIEAAVKHLLEVVKE